jgi:hypothetical protein
MPRPSFEREGIEAEIDRVRSLGLDALRTLWRLPYSWTEQESPATVEPVSPPQKRKLEKSEQRPAPKTRAKGQKCQILPARDRHPPA